MTAESPKPRITAVAKRQKDISTMFAGSSSLVKAEREPERQLIFLVAKTFGLPAVCVNVMGGMPYINKDGLLYKLEEYEGDQIVSLTSKAVQYSTKPGERAIFESTLVLKDKKGWERTFNAIGEADNASVKLEAVKATPNMMAETRSINRVINKAIKAKILKQLYLAMGQAKDITDDTKMAIENAVRVSAEEMTHTPKPVEGVTKQSEAILNVAIQHILKEKSVDVLIEWANKLKVNKIYSDAQKKMLNEMIAGRIKTIEQK